MPSMAAPVKGDPPERDPPESPTRLASQTYPDKEKKRMDLSRTKLRIILLVSAALALVPLKGAAAEGKFLEKEVAVPRETKIAVDMTFGKAELVWVESENDPQEKDIKEASEKDPKDKTWLLIRFHYKNEDWIKHKVDLRVVLLGPDREAYAEGGRSATFDPKQTDDTITFPLRVKTLDWPKASKLKILVTYFD